MNPHHFTHTRDGLDIVHDDGEVQINFRAHGKRAFRTDEDARARDVGDVFMNEGVVRLELFVDGEALVPPLAARVHVLPALQIELLDVVFFVRYKLDTPHK